MLIMDYYVMFGWLIFVNSLYLEKYKKIEHRKEIKQLFHSNKINKSAFF